MFVDMGNAMFQTRVPLLVYLFSMSIIAFGQVPRFHEKPYNLTCISYNYINLTCSGVLVKPTANWTMQFRFAGGWNKWASIPNNHCQLFDGVHVSCFWWDVYKPLSNMTFSRSVCHQIRIGVMTGNKTQWSKNLTFMPFEKVKPDPVRFLEYNYTSTSTSMELRWLPPDLPSTIRLKYKLEINSEENWNVSIIIYKPRSSVNVIYNLTHLTPYVNYTVTVYARPVAANGEIYWSQGSIIMFKTPDDVPGSPPNLTTGSFITFDCSDLNMCLILYWKNPLRKYHHGICSYEIRIDPDMIKVTNISYRVNYKFDQLLTKAYPHAVSMWMLTRKGSSAHFAELTVPSWPTAVTKKPKWVAVEIGDNGTSVSWAVDMTICARITSVTFYWCAADLRDFINTLFFDCHDNLDWDTVIGINACRQPNYHWLYRTRDQSSIRYAVSITVDGVSGGMVWEIYRFTKINAVPKQPMYEVTSPIPGQLQVTVLFDTYYESTGGRPYSYQILYDALLTSHKEVQCPKDGKTKSFLATLTNPIMILDDLVPDTKYVVCVTPTNNAGQGKMGNPVVGVTSGTKESLQWASIVGIAVPTIILFTVILAVIVRFLKSALRDRISMIDNIQVPKNLYAYSYIKSSPSSNAENQPAEQQGKTTYNLQMVLLDTVCTTSVEDNVFNDNSHGIFETIIVKSKGNNSGPDNSIDISDLGSVKCKGENCCLDISRDTFDLESFTVKSNPCECKNSPDFRINEIDNEKCKNNDYFTECQVSTKQDSSSKISKVPNAGQINNNSNNSKNVSNKTMKKCGTAAILEKQSSGEIMSDYVTAI